MVRAAATGQARFGSDVDPLFPVVRGMLGDLVTVRRATADDLASIAAIQDAAPRAASWEPAGYLQYDCFVAMAGDAVAGFLVSRQTGPGEREILNVAAAPAHRRRGVARRLLEQEIAAGNGSWFLEVRESNTPAINFYKSLGFEPAGRRSGYYQDPPEAAIVMRFFS